jgi:hypothetical protein
LLCDIRCTFNPGIYGVGLNTFKQLEERNVAVGIVVGAIFVGPGIAIGMVIGMGLN